ncbi:8959_t:CDS:2, partial [Scutellospora calospora]
KDEFDWLYYEENEDSDKMFFHHANTQDHKKSLPIAYNQTTIEYGFKQLISSDKLKIIQNIQYVYFLAKNHYTTHSLKKAQDIIADSPVTLYSEYGTYDNDISARKFIKAISFVIEESLINEIQNSLYWSIQINESNMIKQEKILAIISKHLSDNYLITYFLSIIQLDNAVAKLIVDSINQFLLAKKLDLNNIFHIGSDSASTILGKNNGVAAIFKKQNPFLLEHYYISYRLALAAKDATKNVSYFENYDSIINHLYSYLLSLSNIVSNLYRILDSVKVALEEDSSKNIVAYGLYNMMDQNFYLAIK